VHVIQLWRHPVKSMVGETVDTVELDELGVVGDRIWATRDLERGGIRGAKQLGGLMTFAARALGGGHAEITLPDGTEVTTADDDVDRRVSEALGHPVRLEALRPPDDLDHYRRGRPDNDDMLTELRAVFGRDDDEPLPDFSVFPPEIVEFESPPGTYYDAFPLLVMTTSALRSLAEALPDSAIDVRRFRPSTVIDTGDVTGHPEFGWRGRTAAIGTARIELGDPCPRCVMVTRRIDDDVPADRRVLRHVVAELDQNVGVYARVVQPGRIDVGDPVSLV
jgi:uncharacterized protein